MVKALRLHHRFYHTEQTYRSSVRRFAAYLGHTAPGFVEKSYIEGFLSYLAVEGRVAVSTQNQTFHALLFLFRILGRHYRVPYCSNRGIVATLAARASGPPHQFFVRHIRKY